PFGAGIAEPVRTCRLVGIPERSLANIRGGELPVLRWLVDARNEPLPLRLPGEIEEQLDDADTVVRKVALVVVDLAEPLLPDPITRTFLPTRSIRELLRLEQLRMDADHQHLFVVRPVENADAPASRNLCLVAPQVVVGQLVGGRDFEPADVDALRVHAAHHVADGAVLSGGVHRLQDDEYAMGALRRQPRLVIGEQRDPGLEDLLRPRPILAVVTSRRGGIEVVREP